jgi:hypothetical protein
MEIVKAVGLGHSKHNYNFIWFHGVCDEFSPGSWKDNIIKMVHIKMRAMLNPVIID